MVMGYKDAADDDDDNDADNDVMQATLAIDLYVMNSIRLRNE